MPRAASAPPPLGYVLTLTALAAIVIVAALSCALLFGVTGTREEDALHLAALIVADVVAFAVFVGLAAAHLLKRVTAPLEHAVEVVDAIADGDLSRRVPAGTTRELATLAESINRMTEHLVDAQSYRVRVEKVSTLGHLAAGVAEELVTPVGEIAGYANILRFQLAGDPVAGQALEGIERESVRIDQVLRGLLDYARPHEHAKPAAVDVNDTLRFALRSLGDGEPMRQLRIGMTLDPGTPAVFGERQDIEQLFGTLLGRAVDAVGGAGDVAVHTRRVPRAALLEASVRRADDPPATVVPRAPSRRVAEWLTHALPPAEAVKIVISDSGTPVAEAEAERIFEPFHGPGEPSDRVRPGLAQAARVVEGLGGTIWVERAREGGAAFHILLPVAMTALARPAPAAKRGKSAEGQRVA